MFQSLLQPQGSAIFIYWHLGAFLFLAIFRINVREPGSLKRYRFTHIDSRVLILEFVAFVSHLG